MTEMSDEDLVRLGWAYVARAPDGKVVSVCADVSGTVEEWMREEIDLGNYVTKLAKQARERKAR